MRAHGVLGTASDSAVDQASATPDVALVPASVEVGRAEATQRRAGPGRRALARALGIAGALSYNWWLLVPLKPGLMRSPSELFSNLEVTGQPYATAMQHADLLAGLLLLAAFLVAGGGSFPGHRGEWLAVLLFAAAGAVGGIFPETCADSISASCRAGELSLQLPPSQYLHIVAGIAEFAAITIVVVLAARRTRGEHTAAATIYRAMQRAALVGYPLLGAAYLLDRLGGVMEALFFTGFTIIALTQLFERVAIHDRGGLLSCYD